MNVKGIDVSRWQGEINWEKAKTAGAQFAIIRAGSIDGNGNPYEDFQFERNSSLAPPVMPVGFYWYFRPNQSSSIQADHFVNLIQDKDWKIYPVADVEEHGGLSPQKVADVVWLFLNRIHSKLNVRPMVYTSPGFWNSRVARSAWAADFPLWVAHWNVQKPILPYDWRDAGVDFTFWQTHVGQDGPDYGMASMGLDHDQYNGDWEKFVREFNIDGEVPPPQETMPVDDFVIEKVYPMMVENWGYDGPKPVK